MRCRVVLAASVAMLIAGVVRTAPVYDKRAQVFLSRTTADGVHVGDHVCFETTRAIDCFPDKPRTDYRLEFSDGTFATCRFIAGTNDDLDAIAMIFEKKDKNTTFAFVSSTHRNHISRTRLESLIPTVTRRADQSSAKLSTWFIQTSRLAAVAAKMIALR